jgi:Asp-tRNA(Asn)/Glu-tRNA(Gln) amidotransferase A subunit family amidase
VRYELLLQAKGPGLPYEEEKVERLLAERKLRVAADGTRLWPLASGDVEVRPLQEGGETVATVIRIPLSAKPELVRHAVEAACELAKEAGASVVDPQLARSLSAADADAVADQYLANARYAGEMLGVSEALEASFAAPQEGLQPSTKRLLMIVGGVIVAWLVLERLL